MHYKTIVLELLQAQPGLHHYLRLSRKLLAEMDRYANDLRSAHQDWQDRGIEPSAALELAVEEIAVRIVEEARRHDPADGA